LKRINIYLGLSIYLVGRGGRRVKEVAERSKKSGHTLPQRLRARPIDIGPQPCSSEYKQRIERKRDNTAVLTSSPYIQKAKSRGAASSKNIPSKTNVQKEKRSVVQNLMSVFPRKRRDELSLRDGSATAEKRLKKQNKHESDKEDDSDPNCLFCNELLLRRKTWETNIR